MRSHVGWIVPLLVALAVACSTVDPDECWPNTSGGLGGGGPIPIGAGVGVGTGDFISPPKPGPLGTAEKPNPCITPADPMGGTDCDNKCFSEYDAAMSACAKAASAADLAACQDSAFKAFQQCRAGCTGDPVEQCKKLCDKIHDRCHANCTKKDPTPACHDQCNQEYASCLKDCD